MAYKALPPQDVLRQLFDYDSQTGDLLWRERPIEGFLTVRAGRLWNTIYAGKPAFTGLHQTGYQHGRIFGQRYKKHRIVWKWVYGHDPVELDHLNGCRSDNRIANLREVTRLENARNQRASSANTTGATGVVWHKMAGKWVATIGTDMRREHLGLFDSFDDAVAARRAAEVRYDYHPNHGRR